MTSDQDRAPAGPRPTSAPVVVGISDAGLASHREALQFAVEEANLRHADIVLAHGCEPLTTATALAPTTSLQQRRSEASRLLGDARRSVSRRLDQGQQTREVISDLSGVETLVSLSATASLIVLQRRRANIAKRLHSGSTTSRVCAQAQVPVAVLKADGEQIPDDAQIVVGIDSRGHAWSALAAALAEADLRHRRVTSIHVWRPPAVPPIYGYVAADPEERSALQLEAEIELAEAVAGWESDYPHIVIERQVMPGSPPQVLVEASIGAQLVVVGRHSGHHVASFGLGTVARYCLQHARCPVLVTPTSRPTRQAGPG